MAAIGWGDTLQRRSNHLIGTLAVLLVAAGVLYSLTLGDRLRFLPDEADYVALAENLTTQHAFSLDGLRPTAYRAPGYPALLAIIHAAGGGIVAFRIANYILLASGILVIRAILKKQFNRTSPVIGAILIIAYPVLFYTAGTIYPQTLAAFLLLLSIYFYTQSTLQSWDFIAGGLALGSLILTVPTNVFLLAIFAAWFGFQKSYRRSRWFWLSLVLAASMVGGWVFRNYARFGAFIFVTSNSGENLLVGNSENATPNGGRTADISRYEAQAAGLDEITRDRFFHSQAVEYIANHPQETVRLYLLKLLNYFNFRNDLATSGEGSGWRDLLMLLTYSPLLLVFVLRINNARRFKLTRFENFLVVIYLANALVSAIFFTRIRFRLPYDTLLILIAAAFLDRFIFVRKV